MDKHDPSFPSKTKRRRLRQKARRDLERSLQANINVGHATKPVSLPFFFRLPYELIDMILLYLDPLSVLFLSRVNKQLARILLSDRRIWPRIRAKQFDMPPPPIGMSEPRYLSYIWGAFCHVCEKPAKFSDAFVGVKTCNDHLDDQLISIKEINLPYREYWVHLLPFKRHNGVRFASRAYVQYISDGYAKAVGAAGGDVAYQGPRKVFVEECIPKRKEHRKWDGQMRRWRREVEKDKERAWFERLQAFQIACYDELRARGHDQQDLYQRHPFDFMAYSKPGASRLWSVDRTFRELLSDPKRKVSKVMDKLDAVAHRRREVRIEFADSAPNAV